MSAKRIKKVMVLNLPRVNGYAVVREERFEHKDVGALFTPISHLQVASILRRAGYEVIMIDASGFNISTSEVKSKLKILKPDLLFARIAFDCYKNDLEILSYAKSLGIITITRNRIISFVPSIKKEVLSVVDLFLEQDPDLVIENVINNLDLNLINNKNNPFENIPGTSYLKNGMLIKCKEAEEADINTLPIPAYELLGSIEPYHTQLLPKPFVSIYTTKGCPYGCKFCAYARTRFKQRSVKLITQELEYLKIKYKLKSFLIFDDTFTYDKNHVISFCNELIEKKMDFVWSCCTRVDKIDEELLEIMRLAGCVEISFGVESGSQKILDICNKGIKVEQIETAAKLCRKFGIKFYCMFVIGLPGENRKTIKETKILVKKIKPFYAQFGLAVPFPNTDMFSYYKEKGLIRTFDWSEYCPLNPEPVCRTEELNYNELKKFQKSLYFSYLINISFIISHISLTNIFSNLNGLRIFIRKILAILKNSLIR